MESNTKEEYKFFVVQCSSAAKSVANYSDFLRINQCIARIKGLNSFDLYDIVDTDELEALEGLLNNDADFLEYNKKGKMQYTNALKMYHRFLNARSYFSNLKLKTSPRKVAHPSPLPLQQIFYGAPGTGKSHIINQETAGESVVRTTFHPDSDYSTFVGAYKPTTKVVHLRDMSGHIVKIEGEEITEERISYEFVPQAFLQAYVKAWKLVAEAVEGTVPRRQFLIVEEINRGNCAQIFGDLFQLLDRNDEGFSDYPITADNDMRKHLAKAFQGMEIPMAQEINALYHEPNMTEQVLRGEKLLLPNNLFIWATMNTSDQSLFPIDSAFKRRWDWQYMPIDQGKDEEGKPLEWVISVGQHEYDWWQFVTTVNQQIQEATQSEDKKLGFFFCKARDGRISAERFVGKVLFYLWNDVFKDMAQEDEGIFRNIPFDAFYQTGKAGKVEVCLEKVTSLLDGLGLVALEADPEETEMEQSTSAIDYILKVNGVKAKYINAVPYMTIQEYIRLNPNKSADEVLNFWQPFSKCSRHKWVIADEGYIAQCPPAEAARSEKLVCGDGNPVWVNKDGWTHHPANPKIKDSLEDFIQTVNSANIGISITETPAGA